MSRLKNVNYNTSNARIPELMETFFTKDIVTMGTLCRKMKKILFALISTTDSAWEVTCILRKVELEVIFGDNSNEFTITISPKPSYKISSALSHIETVFTEDKTFPNFSCYGELRYPVENKYIHLSVYKNVIFSPRVLYIRIEYQPIDYWERIKRLFVKSSDPIWEILKRKSCLKTMDSELYPVFARRHGY